MKYSLVKGNIMGISTKTGDKGITSTLNNKRISKSSSRPEALGSIDEFSSYLGIIAVLVEKNPGILKQIISIQKDLYKLNVELSISEKTPENLMLLGPGDSARIERWIKYIETSIEPVKKFVLPGGGNILSAHIDYTRTLCRKSERRVVALFEKEGTLDGDTSILNYLNRLSDFLFLLARKTESVRTYISE
jgi:cob(I)alamin adenosyltransferase